MEYKSIDFTPWGGLDGFLLATSNGSDTRARASLLKSVVPWLAKANMMISNYTANMPFDIVSMDGEVIDTSTDWQNVTGGMDNPRRLIGLLASSLCGGSAYLIPEYASKLIVDLRYISPHTVTPQIGKDGVTGFERMLDDGKREIYAPEDMAYFWLPDSDVEIGPPLTSPMSTALLAAELLASMSGTMKVYSDRGFVPAYIGNASGMPSKDEREKAENYLTRFLRGAYNSVVKIMNSDKFSLQKVGAGMEEMKSAYTEIQQSAIEDIGTAHGIPAALFMSDKAFASEVNPLLKTMYESSVFVSVYHTIEETFNSQILKRYSVRLQFRPETLDVFQEDENSRSNSVSSYVNAISSNPKVARFVMDFVGVDLDEEQERQFDEIVASKEEAAADVRAQTETPPADSPALTPDETKDIALWYSKALAWHSKGKGGIADWENKHLREEIAAPIRLKLATATNEAEITRAFEIGATVQDDSIKALADAINRMVDEGK